ncbi:hypothetical protein ACQP2F_42720 [Actinoplanes sp. CA-030573]|uniref:hypothetical protein n=1 Tax=Actinoplanes sp. CA-030573 TaxID=3239898 RepID=UPI003D8E58AB
MRTHPVSGGTGRRVALAALAVLLLPLAACSKTPAGATPGAAGQKNAQPFSAFLGDALGVVDYAQLKALGQCMADAGYPQNLRVMGPAPRNPFPQLVLTDATFGPPTEQVAKEHGFGQDEAPVPPAIASFDPNYDHASDQCTSNAWKKLPPNAEKVYYSYFDLGNALSRPFLMTVYQRVGQPKWKTLLTCLAGKGYHTSQEDSFFRVPDPGLFGVPLGDSAPDPAETWKPKEVPGTVEVGPATPAKRYVPSGRESDFAVAWFTCERDTGIAKLQMDTAMQVQQELVAKNEAKLTELNPQIQAIAKQAAALIGQQ